MKQEEIALQRAVGENTVGMHKTAASTVAESRPPVREPVWIGGEGKVTAEEGHLLPGQGLTGPTTLPGATW